MDKIDNQKINCENLEQYESLIDSFPIVLLIINNQLRKALVYKFTNNNRENYILLGIVNSSERVEKEQFERWLQVLNYLIHYDITNGLTESYVSLLRLFRNSLFTRNVLFTQEGYDIITNKEAFSPKKEVIRTVSIDLLPNNDGIAFSNSCSFNDSNKALSTGFFNDFYTYESSYFLNPVEINEWGYQNALDYAKFNSGRLTKNCKTQWIKDACSKYLHNLSSEKSQFFLLELLDAIISQEKDVDEIASLNEDGTTRK